MNSYTTRAKLAKPAVGDTLWGATLNANATALDAVDAVGAMAVTTHELPSATLLVDVAGGSFVALDGSTVAFAGALTFAVTASVTRCLYLDGTASWALAQAASFPTTAHVRLAVVTTGTATITSVTDARQTACVAGGSAASHVGFFGVGGIVQPTGGSATAGGTYTSVEQGMIQRMYNGLRALGLLS